MPRSKTLLWLIRHAETEWNASGRFQGHTDIALNEVGLVQATLVGERLAQVHRSTPFAAVYSSDLQRALVTAQRIGLPVTIDARLRERHYGVLSSLTPAEMQVQHPESYRHWRARTPDFVMPGGESLEQFSARVINVLNELASAHRGQQVVVVSHGGVLDAAYRAAMGIPLTQPRAHALLNASVNQLQIDSRGQFSVIDWGDVAHLGTVTKQDESR